MSGSTDSAVTAKLNAVHLGIVAGFFTCLAYPLVAFLRLPLLATTALAACFGPALAVASFGLKGLLDLERPMVSSTLGLLLNALGGVLFTAMALVQLAIGSLVSGEKVSAPITGIWLGIGKAWDAYVGLGTICFALAMLRHPRFGRVFAFSGLAIAVGLLVLNFYTFPAPPADAGLVDPGPAIGLWYLVVTIEMWRSLSWAKRRASATVAEFLLS
ncbi:MAG: hypothetical protein ABSH28_01610 [Acidobacteriota bacterium]|jgi:hypothetical protein